MSPGRLADDRVLPDPGLIPASDALHENEWYNQDFDGYKITEEPLYTKRQLRMVCVGAGAAGLQIAYKAERLLENVDLQVYEKNTEIGGCWLANRYPGCSCDIPSHSYQYTWARNPKWSHYYSSSTEIWQYFKDVATKFNIEKHVQFNTTVESATWDEESGTYRLCLINPEGIVLMTDIPGLNLFQGKLMHSAQWDGNFDLTGKTVAVIGGGSSGVQIIPNIQPKVGKLVAFLRSPTWVTTGLAAKHAAPGGTNFAYTEEQMKTFAEDPVAYDRYCLDIEGELNKRFNMMHLNSNDQKASRKEISGVMSARLNNIELAKRLIPEFALGCRRMTPGPGFLETLFQNNVEVVHDSAAQLTETGIVDGSGIEYKVNVVICATGFDTSFAPHFTVTGRKGAGLRKEFGEFTKGYLGIAIQNFPNFPPPDRGRRPYVRSPYSCCGPFAVFTAEPYTVPEGKTPCYSKSTSTLFSILYLQQTVRSLYLSWRSTEPNLNLGLGTDALRELANPQLRLACLLSQSPRSLGETSDISSVASSPTLLTPFRMPAEVEWLLHHYTTHVIDLMTAVATPMGPWKTVHLPRALQGCGELAFRGTTSHARNALLHALLTISAYSLAAKHITAGQTLEAYNWQKVALRHTTRSLTQLKACLRADCPASERGKYKEILAVMLSMITIDVCSGENRSSEWHLKGLEDFIRATRRKPSRHYSRKAQALHRNYVYLRVMRETTDLRCEAPDSSLGPYSETMTAWLCRPLGFLDSFDAAGEWLQESGPCSSVNFSACEFVYGVPLQLLILASKTSELIRRKKTFTRHCPDSVGPALFLSMCDKLELEVLKWPVERTVGNIWKLPIAKESQGLITDQTRAFHQALVIYFSRLVRGVHRRYLQPYAESIIDHLEAVERIKHEANLASCCISWPGFVGAAEAMAGQLRSRYLQWSRSVRFYDLGTYDRAEEVILEVWERDKTDKGLGPGCDWPTIIEAKNIRLMLT